MDYKSYKILLEERRKWYKTIKKIYCPCLRADVVFNSKGFYHIRYDSSGRERPLHEQVIRLNLLPLVVPLIRQSKSIHEYRISSNNTLELFAVQGEINGNRIRVVLKRKFGSNIIYFSVMKPR